MHRNSSYHGLTVESPAAERKSAAGLLTPRNSSLMRNSSTTSRNTGSTAPRPQLKKKDRLERALAFNLGKLSTANEVASSGATPILVSDPSKCPEASDFNVLTVAQFSFDTNVKEQLEKINKFDRLPAITEWSRSGTAAGSSTLLIKNHSEPSFYLPVLHRPTIAHDTLKTSDQAIKNSEPRPVSSHRHEAENLVLRNIDQSHYNSQYEDDHARLMRNIKDSKKYHLNRSLLLQLRRGGQHYGEYNNKDLDSLKHEVQTEGIYEMINRGELPISADLSPIVKQNLHFAPHMDSASMDTNPVPLHQFGTKFSPLAFERVQEESFSSQLRFHRPVMKSNVSFFRNPGRKKQNGKFTFPIVIHQHPPFISRPRVPQHSASTSREALDMSSSTILQKDHRFIWARRSVVHKENPTYKTFADKNQGDIMAIEAVLRQLSKMLEECDVDYAELNCARIEHCAYLYTTMPFRYLPFAECITNQAAIELMRAPGSRFKGKNKSVLAAITIQSKYKQHKISVKYKNHLRRTWAANAFRRGWIIKMARRRFSNMILERRHSETDEYNKQRKYLIENWSSKITTGKRIMIHFGYQPEIANMRIPDLNVGRQVLYILEELSLLKEEDTEVILVVPYMGEDLNRYYKDIIANGLPEKNPIWVGRLHFIVPETAKYYRKPNSTDTEAAMKLPEMLLTSQKALKLISLICEKKPAVVFVDQVGNAEISLSAKLKLPLMAPTVEGYIHHLHRSNVHQFLLDAGLPVPPALKFGTEVEPHDFGKAALNLIKQHMSMSSWQVFNDRVKVRDIDLFQQGANIGLIDPGEQIEFLRNKDIDKTSEEGRKKVAKLRKHILTRLEPQSLQNMISSKTLLDSIIVEGLPCQLGNPKMRVIEFSMSVNPKGGFDLLGTFEQVISPDNVVIGRIVPQQYWEHSELMKCAAKIANFCPSRGIIGNLTVEVIVWKDAESIKHHHVRNFVNRLSISALRGMSVYTISGCTFDATSGKLGFKKEQIPIRMKYLRSIQFSNMNNAKQAFVKNTLHDLGDAEHRVAFYSESTSNSQMEHIPRDAIFKMTNHGIHYDLWKRRGSFIPIRDQLSSASIPLVCFGNNYNDVLEMFLKNLVLIDRHFYIPGSRAKVKTNFKQLAASVINHILSDWDVDDSEKLLPDLDLTDLEGLVLKVVHIPRSRPATPEEKEVLQETVRKIEHHISNETSLILRAEIMSAVFAEEDATFNCPIIDPPYEPPPVPRPDQVSEATVSRRTLEIVTEIEALLEAAEKELKAKEKSKPKNEDDLPELTYEERLARRFKFADDDEKMKNICTRVERIETRKSALMDGIDNVITTAMKILEQQGDEKKESVMAALNKIDKKIDKELANKRDSISSENNELSAKVEMMHLLDFLTED